MSFLKWAHTNNEISTANEEKSMQICKRDEDGTDGTKRDELNGQNGRVKRAPLQQAQTSRSSTHSRYSSSSTMLAHLLRYCRRPYHYYWYYYQGGAWWWSGFVSGARLCLDLDMEGALRAESVVGGRVEDRIGLSKLWRMHGHGKIQIGCLLCYLLVYAK